jgi:TetR/AcrR family transcriptional repressor of lmrAB and yxaGH operons
MADTKSRMVETALRLFQRTGYHATSWRTLIDAGKTPWGSAHHHFPGGKEQLGVAAIALGDEAMAGAIRQAFDASRSVPDAVRAWCAASAERLEKSGYREGCPIATVALETVPGVDALTDACSRAFEHWTDAIAAKLVAAGVKRKRAAELATVVLAGIEGALVVARVGRSKRPLVLTGEHLAQLLESELP